MNGPSPLQVGKVFYSEKKKIEMRINTSTCNNYLTLLLGIIFRRSQTIYTNCEN